MDELMGYILIVIGALIFITSTYSMIIAKIFMPYTGNIILDWIKDDEHYIFLVPSMVVTIMIFAYWNWVSMKFFRHNWVNKTSLSIDKNALKLDKNIFYIIL